MTGGMGFVQPSDKTEDKLDVKVEKTAQGAAKKKFSPEFMNRLDKVVVFHPLRQEQLEEILEIELGMVQQRVWTPDAGSFCSGRRRRRGSSCCKRGRTSSTEPGT